MNYKNIQIKNQIIGFQIFRQKPETLEHKERISFFQPYYGSTCHIAILIL